MSEKQNISERVRILRARRSWTQQELAEAMGYDRNYISMVEGGREPGPKFLKLLGLLESSPIGESLTSEQALQKAEDIDKNGAEGKARESEPGYETMKHIMFIEEHGTPEQIALARALLKTLREQLKPEQSGDKSR